MGAKDRHIISFESKTDLWEALGVQAQLSGVSRHTVAHEACRAGMSSNAWPDIERDRHLAQLHASRVYVLGRLQEFLKELAEEVANGIALMQAGEQWPPKAERHDE